MRTTAKESLQNAQTALNVYSQTGSYGLTATTLQCAELTIRNRVQRALVMGLRADTVPSPVKLKSKATKGKGSKEQNLAPENLLAADRRTTATSIERDVLRTKLEQSEHENEEKSKRLDVLMAIEKSKDARFTIPKYRDTKGQGIFVGVASDWHVEEDVDPSKIDGFENEYNPKIARQRATKFFQSYVFMLDAWRHVGTCDTAVLAILGDIITGYIHEELVEDNHMSPLRALDLGGELLGSGIEHILKHGKLKKLVIPWCYGNHGRTTLKSRIQTGADNSFEYYLGAQMKKFWAKEKRVAFHVAEGYHNNLDLFDGYRIRFHHGDAIKSNGGVGGITVPVRKKIGAWNKGAKKPADLDVFGHFHQLMDGGDFVVNGSLIGYNPFAVSIGASYARASQACFWIDSEKGKTMFGELYV